MDEVCVKCGYLKGSEFDLVTSGFIVIAGERIAGLTRAESGANPDSYRDTRQFEHCVAVPALINSHVHLRDVVAAEAAVGANLEASVMGPDSIRARRIAAVDSSTRIDAIRRALVGMAKLGTSTVADFCDGGPEGANEVRAAAAEVPIDVIVLGRLREPQTSDAVKADAALSDTQSSELETLLLTADGFATSTINDYGDRAWQEIAARVRAAGKLLAVHLAEQSNQSAVSLALRGRNDFERVVSLMPDHVVHLTQISPRGLEAVVASGLQVVMCPRSNAMLGIGYPPLLELLKQNHPVALGTDNLMINTPNLWREMEYTAKSFRALRHDPKAISAHDLLRAASINGATALKVDSNLGTIDVGKRADFILVRLPYPQTNDPSEVKSFLAHRVELWDIVGRFYRGRWIGTGSDQGVPISE